MLLRLFLAAISGAILSLSYTGLYWPIFSWFCIGILIVSIAGATPKISFFCGFLHAIAFVLLSVPWFATVLYLHGGVSRAGGWALLLLIAASWGILSGSFAMLVQQVSRQRIANAFVAAPFLWVAFEFIRERLPEIGFPWNLLGYPASANAALVQITSVTGMYGLSFLVAAFNSLWAWSFTETTVSIQRRSAIFGAAVLALLCVLFIGPRMVPQASAYHVARGIQLNFPEVDSYDPNWFSTHDKDMREIEQLSLAQTGSQPDLLIWPETPAPFSYQNSDFVRWADEVAIRFKHPFLAGVVEWKAANDTASSEPGKLVPYNSAVLINEYGHRKFSYDKVHLVPFGEYEPFPLIHQVVKNVSNEVGGFEKGSRYLIGEISNGYTFGTFICYEAIFGGEVRKFAAGGADLFINISNDGWFGRSSAADQHLVMARVRAVENRRWLLRVTNNGYTVSVDPYGRVFRPIGPDVRGAVDLPYDFRTEATIYTRYGDWFAWLCIIVSVILLTISWKQNKYLKAA
ncbi:MAG TPA: apolipoprotein N-acyltransferase [Candidatus Eremiobacteraceae bacterium]|nr:apolipoprotein N-acyltransferase [Candidatus Eremiobacteraceae bacterium]